MPLALSKVSSNWFQDKIQRGPTGSQQYRCCQTLLTLRAVEVFAPKLRAALISSEAITKIYHYELYHGLITECFKTSTELNVTVEQNFEFILSNSKPSSVFNFIEIIPRVGQHCAIHVESDGRRPKGKLAKRYRINNINNHVERQIETNSPRRWKR